LRSEHEVKTEAVLRLDPERSTLKDALAHSVKVAAFHYWSHCKDGDTSPLIDDRPLRPLQIDLTNGTVLVVSMQIVAPMPGLDDPAVELAEDGAVRESKLSGPAAPEKPHPGHSAPTIPFRPHEKCPHCGDGRFTIDRNEKSTRRCDQGHWWYPGSGNEQPGGQPSPFVPVPPPPERPETVLRDPEELVDPDRPAAPPPVKPSPKREGERCPECGNMNFRIEPNHFSTRLCSLGHRWRLGEENARLKPLPGWHAPPSAGIVPTEAGGHVKPIWPIQGEGCPGCGSDQFVVARNMRSTRRCLKCTGTWEPGDRGTWVKSAQKPGQKLPLEGFKTGVVGNPPRLAGTPAPSGPKGGAPAKAAATTQAIQAIQGAADMLREAAKLLAVIDSK
jgi:hypothetical protein